MASITRQLALASCLFWIFFCSLYQEFGCGVQQVAWHLFTNKFGYDYKSVPNFSKKMSIVCPLVEKILQH